MAYLALVFALVLSVIHVFAGKLRFLDVIPRSRWLSLAGGASVAYIFVHILPELSRGQQAFEQAAIHVPVLENHVYLLALLGFGVFYGLERLAVVSRASNEDVTGESKTTPGVFAVHIGSFTVYNLLIGYLLLHLEKPGWLSLTFFGVAMGLHFLINDYGLREHHKERYQRYGRWILSLAVLVGLAIGYVTEIHQLLIAMLLAFLAGGVVLNVIKEELPEQRISRFWAFALGALIYTIILLTL